MYRVFKADTCRGGFFVGIFREHKLCGLLRFLRREIASSSKAIHNVGLPGVGDNDE